MNRITDESRGHFESRLLDALTELDAQRPATVGAAPARAMPDRRPWFGLGRGRAGLIGAGIAALAAGAVIVGGPALMSTAQPHPVPAPADTSTKAPNSIDAQPVNFVVVKLPDGSVTVTAHDVVDPAAATESLHQAGITGLVLNAQTSSCHATRRPGPDVTAATDTGTVTIPGRSFTHNDGGGPGVSRAGSGVLVAIGAKPETLGSGDVLPSRDIVVLVYADGSTIPTCVPQVPTGH
jgi:hypothetical protein